MIVWDLKMFPWSKVSFAADTLLLSFPLRVLSSRLSVEVETSFLQAGIRSIHTLKSFHGLEGRSQIWSCHVWSYTSLSQASVASPTNFQVLGCLRRISLDNFNFLLLNASSPRVNFRTQLFTLGADLTTLCWARFLTSVTSSS